MSLRDEVTDIIDYYGAGETFNLRTLKSEYTPHHDEMIDRLTSLLAPPPVPKDLHRDSWMMDRIKKTLEAIRYADSEGLETELDLLAFAEDVLKRYGQGGSA